MGDFQNSICNRQIIVGRDKNKQPVYVTIRIVTTNTRLMVYKGGEKIGEAGVLRKSDFDFESLFRIAMTTSGKSINVA